MATVLGWRAVLYENLFVEANYYENGIKKGGICVVVVSACRAERSRIAGACEACEALCGDERHSWLGHLLRSFIRTSTLPTQHFERGLRDATAGRQAIRSGRAHLPLSFTAATASSTRLLPKPNTACLLAHYLPIRGTSNIVVVACDPTSNPILPVLDTTICGGAPCPFRHHERRRASSAISLLPVQRHLETAYCKCRRRPRVCPH